VGARKVFAVDVGSVSGEARLSDFVVESVEETSPCGWLSKPSL